MSPARAPRVPPEDGRAKRRRLDRRGPIVSRRFRERQAALARIVERRPER